MIQSYGPTSTPNRGFEALVFAVYYSAVISLEPEKVPELFGMDKESLLNRYRTAVENALANAKFLQSEELTTLQAFVLFIVGFFFHNN